jgi:alpha-glucosidase
VSFLPGSFDDFKVLDGRIGEYVVIARKSGNDWFIGGLTNREERTLDVRMDFLSEDKKFLTTLYKDTPDTHFINNRESYAVEEIIVEKSSVLKVRMAPGGGFAIWIRDE